MKIVFGTNTNNNTGKTKLELRYLVWERKKRKFYIDYLKQNKIIHLEGEIFLNGKYIIKINLHSNMMVKNHLYINQLEYLLNKKATNYGSFFKSPSYICLMRSRLKSNISPIFSYECPSLINQYT